MASTVPGRGLDAGAGGGSAITDGEGSDAVRAANNERASIFMNDFSFKPLGRLPIPRSASRCRYPRDMDGVADDIGFPLLALGSFRHGQMSPKLHRHP